MNARSPLLKPLLLAACITVVVMAWLSWKGQIGHVATDPPAAAMVAARDGGRHPSRAAAPVPTPTSSPASPAGAHASGRTFDTFQLRPFPVAKASGAHEWTAADGKDPDAILEIAHNPAEVERMLEENIRIERRQLVYRKEPAFVVVQQARAKGEAVRRLTVPGFDGQELEMEVVRADLDPSGLRGTFAGQLAGRQQSLVTLAFREGREAFSVMSPEDGIFLQGHPREPGEIIVTSFDPDKYQPLPGGEPIRMPVLPPAPPKSR
jgi:hypothetical protein